MQVAHHMITWIDWYRDYGEPLAVPRVLDEIAAAGYAGVELHGGPAVLGPANVLRRQIERAGLQAVAYSSFLGATASRLNTRQYQADLDHAADLGITTIVVIGGWPSEPRRVSWEEDYRLFAANLARAQEYADRYDQIITFHPQLGCLVEVPAEVDRLAQHLPSLRLCIDTGHLIAVRADPAELIRQHPGRTAHVHLKDWNTRAHTFAELGSGDAGLDLAGFLATLHADGYTGWLTIERDGPVLPPIESAHQSLSYLNRIISGPALTERNQT